MLLVTGGTLGTPPPPHKRAPGNDIFKGHQVITGVCFHPCYTVPGMCYGRCSVRAPQKKVNEAKLAYQIVTLNRVSSPTSAQRAQLSQ